MDVSSYFSLKDKNALIIGAGSGIGRETALIYSAAGASVAVADINMENAEKISQEIIDQGHDATAFEVDVVNRTSVVTMVNSVVSAMGHIDVLVNSAGINRRCPAEDFSESDWDSVIDINLKGTFMCCKYVGREMIKRKSGSIVNLASMSGLIVNKDRNISAYTSSKGGVIMLTKSLAVEWAKHNIRVNALAPGYVMTPINPWMKDPSVNKPTLELIPMNRFAEPLEIATAALFLASQAASYVTGTILGVDGGYTAY
jgi:NAD(P)-dependent dehydrogenase (short-subunit alcohol dehydrogenase family)